MSGNYIRHFFTLMALGVSLTALAQTDEEKVGKAAAAQVLGAAPLVAADVAQQYVNVLGHALSAHSGVTYKWHFGVIKSDAINAFAMPGGYIGYFLNDKFLAPILGTVGAVGT